MVGRACMKARERKAIGGLGILVFPGRLCLGRGHARQPPAEQWAIRLVYYAVVGTSWGLPLIPLISWMNRGG